MRVDGFHDSSLVRIATHGEEALLSFEDVYIDNMLRSVEVLLEGVSEILCDDVKLERLEVIFDEGEVLTLSTETGELSMIVIWTDFKKRMERTYSYCVRCRSVTINIGSVSLNNPAAV